MNALKIQQVITKRYKTKSVNELKKKLLIFVFLIKGQFPNCTCTEKDYIYSAYINECFIECGNGMGIHPRCYCGKEFDSIYDVEARFCKPIGYAGRRCPPGSFGIAPNCRCAVGHFQIYGWGCFFAYALGPTNYPCDKWPQCDLGIDRNTLLSLVG